MCIQIMLPALCRASGSSIACWRRCGLRGGGVGVILHKSSRVLFYEFCIFWVFLWNFVGYGCNIFTLALCVFMTFSVILILYSSYFNYEWMLDWMNAWMNDEKMDAIDWMDVWMKEWRKLGKMSLCLFRNFAQTQRELTHACVNLCMS